MDGATPELVLFKATSGCQSALLRWPGGKSRLLHSAIAPETEAVDIPLPEIWGDVLLCLGTGLGYHLEGLKNITRPLTIVLCDCWPDLVLAAAERLAGSIHQVVPTVLESVSIVASAKIQILRHPASYRVSAERFEVFAETIFRESLQGSIAGADKQNVLPRTLLLHGHHFLQEEIRHGLCEIDCPHHLLEYEGDHRFTSWESQVLKAIQEFRPELILSVNMKGIDSDGILMDNARRLGIPVHAWFVDDPRPIALPHSSKVYPYIQAWCWERSYLPWLKKKGFNSPRWLPLAGDPAMFKPGKVDPIVDVTHPLVFTGSAMGKNFLDTIRRSFLWDDKLTTIVDLRSEELLRGHRLHETLLEGLPLPFEDERNLSWLTCLILHTASHKRRVRTLSPLVTRGLVCAGDPQSWRDVLGNQVRVIPDLDYRRELGAHYRKCDINLNITSCQMPTAVNQRVFDVPLSGAFLLTDNQADLAELFAPSEIVSYASQAELHERLEWFSSHATEKNRIVVAGRNRVLKEHTYAHRLRDLFRLRNV
jgi:spore maturation protein CgeB